MWPAVRAAVEFVLGLQTRRGEIAWERAADGTPAGYALLTGCASTYQSLRCAVLLAEHMGEPQPDWELAAGQLGHVVACHPEAFADKSRVSMDWYYPVLAGPVRGPAALARLAGGWQEFVVPGLGVRVLGVDIAGAGKRSLPDYARSLQSVHAGDTVTVVLSNGESHPFTVVGIYDDQFRDADMKAYITTTAADQLLPHQQDTADTVYVKTSPSADSARVAGEIRAFSPNLKVLDFTSLEGTIHDQTAGFNLISNILGLVSALVAAITIFIVTYIDLVNRRKQIGIERAIGIRGGAILASYCLKAVVYAIVGVALGVVLFKGAVVPFVASHPFHFPNGPVTLAPSSHEIRRDALVLVIVAIIGALLPAWRSMRIRILDAIWG